MRKNSSKIILAIIVALCLFATTFAQKKKQQEEEIHVPELPKNEKTNKVSYEGVIQVKGAKDDLFNTALQWFKGFYNNPTDVIREKNEEEGKIFGKARFNIYSKNDKEVKINDGLVLYEITIQCKDGRYKYEITSIVHKQSTAFPIERWIEENAKAYHAQYASYLVQMDEYMQQLITSLKSTMGAGQPSGEEDW